MVIYDKNQFTFNLVFLLILVASIMITIIYSQNYIALNRKYQEMSQRLDDIESNQNFNFIQGSHNEVDHQLTSEGFFIRRADDYGVFNGPSMQPVIFDGNIVVEKNYDKSSKLEEGQIVRFLRDDSTAVIHRVRADYGSEVYVQGDSLKEGEIISKDKITHVVVGVLFT
ncbi:S24/S26 family peptidase [Candidatus Woesearchaeota archaeon]|nr:S24/S26 family peptidase [Candidatus Woesearchaeota archaeon]